MQQNGVELHGHHDGLERLANVGGRGEAGRRLLLQAAEDDAFKLDWKMWRYLADRGRFGKLDGANALKVGRIGAMEGMAAGGKLIEDQAEGEDVGLDAGLAGDELLRRHVGDGAAASGVGGARVGRVALAVGPGGIELGLVRSQPTGEAEVENFDEAAIGEHDVGGLEVAMEDAQIVRGGEAVRDLDARRERELQACRSLGDDLVERLAGDVLHDDVGFFAVAGVGWSYAYLVDGADVGVVDGRGQPGFAKLRGAHLLDGQVAALQQLEDNGALEEGVVRQVDHAAAARADLANEFVLLDDASLHASIIASRELGKMNAGRGGVSNRLPEDSIDSICGQYPV